MRAGIFGKSSMRYGCESILLPSVQWRNIEDDRRDILRDGRIGTESGYSKVGLEDVTGDTQCVKSVGLTP